MKKITLISSTGGHWSQITELYKILNEKNHVLEIITEKNNTNKDKKNIIFLRQQDRKNKYFIFILVANILNSLRLVIKRRPNYVISTGAGVTLPYLLFAKLFGAKIIFIESFAKINSPTITGRIVYKFADEFFVQWPEMLEYYPKALYKGSLY
ncbi:polysaccharide biosynthesis protein [Bacillus sp. CMF21]|nr:polysaccharide biosynthesis protein [Bacillus sp. CMF21]